MKRWIHSVLKLSILGLLIGVSIGLSWARKTQDIPASTGLPLIPIFLPELGDPIFVGTFHNGDKVVNVIKLISASTIELDGKTYALRGMSFTGNSSIGPHDAISVYIQVSNYLPRVREYNEEQKHWQSKSSLSSGRHTLMAKFGDKIYGPVTFVWRANSHEGLDRFTVYAP